MASTAEKSTGLGPGDGLSLPTTNSPHHHHPGTGSRVKSGLRIRDWVRSPRSGEHRHPGHDTASGSGPGSEPGARTAPERTGNRQAHDPWWKIHLFRGMVNDLRKRAPYYLSDWTDAWNYRVVPATVYMFFAKSVSHPSSSSSLVSFARG